MFKQVLTFFAIKTQNSGQLLIETNWVDWAVCRRKNVTAAGQSKGFCGQMPVIQNA